LTKANTSRHTGSITEQKAKQFLIEQGLLFVDQNIHCRQGEIDLIMKEGDTFVFIEVKYRKNNHFGGAIYAVSTPKQRKLKHCVAFYLHKIHLNEYNTPCRFDVVALEGDINQPQITWLKNAF
jgi:putative endonuclease